MRIIIETDEKQATPVVKTTVGETTTSVGPAIAAGSPPETLLQALGEGITTKTETKTLQFPGSPEARAGAINAGNPPEWLVQAIETATLRK